MTNYRSDWNSKRNPIIPVTPITQTFPINPTPLQNPNHQPMENDFTLRPYGKSELALAYTHGNMSARSALNWFNNELKLYPGLMEQLRQLGYHPYQNTITIAQLRVIVSVIGPP